MSDFYQLTNSTSDFKSRSSDVFDKLANLEKQHDVTAKNQTPVILPDDETASTSLQNPIIPSNAITFKKRPAEDDTFTRPMNKWKKYDLDDVNEHHVSQMGNQHALNDFLRTRVKPSITKELEQKEEEEEVQSTPVFKRPAKRPIVIDDDDVNQQFIPIQVPLPANTTKVDDNNDNDDDTTRYKLKSTRKISRGVMSTNEKKSAKSSTEQFEEKETLENDDDADDDEITDELFEP